MDVNYFILLMISQDNNIFYYIAINIELLKLWDESRVTSLQISLDIGTLTRYCTPTRMPSHIAVT